MKNRNQVNASLELRHLGSLDLDHGGGGRGRENGDRRQRRKGRGEKREARREGDHVDGW